MTSAPPRTTGETHVRVIAHGERVIPVNARRFDQARRQGTVDAMFVAVVDDLVADDVHVLVVDEHAGTVSELTALTCTTRKALRGGLTTQALRDMIDLARPVTGCGDCDGRVCCSQHLAEHLMAMARQERLMLVPSDALAPAADPGF